MSAKSAIQVRALAKEFRLRHAGTGSLKGILFRRRHSQVETLQVLKGVSFDVHQGETVAIVGRNGAGKSTLLSLLARVYKPTSGEVRVHGRLAPLLELGAGFHPELTGYENVFFNGVILGLSRKEMAARIDQIIEFSELKKHIDVPVRTYSSGMLARLGFSVAVHVDAEVLLVDEVLAVGDLDFERKCFATLDDFKAKGGTILFVSHDLDAIKRVADRCIWLKNGQIEAEGSPDDVLDRYTLAFSDPRPAQ